MSISKTEKIGKIRKPRVGKIQGEDFEGLRVQVLIRMQQDAKNCMVMDPKSNLRSSQQFNFVKAK